MAALNFPLEIEKGDNFKMTVTVTPAFDLSVTVGAELTIKNELGGNVTVVTWTSGGGQITLNASSQVIVKVDDSVTIAIGETGDKFTYLLRLTDFDPDIGLDVGSKFRLMTGNVTLTEDI